MQSYKSYFMKPIVSVSCITYLVILFFNKLCMDYNDILLTICNYAILTTNKMRI